MNSGARDVAAVCAMVAALAGCLWVLVSAGMGDDSGGGVSAPPPTDLRAAPWVARPNGAPTIDAAFGMPSAVFPAGVDYPGALRALYRAARTDGRLPAGAELAPPLPAEVVLVRSATGRQRVRVSLLAPWGWTPEGRRVRAPRLRAAAEAHPDAIAHGAGPLPRGVDVDAPRLRPCQIAVGTPEHRPSCE